MNAEQWTALLWKVIIALAPIIAAEVMRLIQNFILTRSEATQNRIHYWVEYFIRAAEQLEPDPAKRKAWVVACIVKMFPKLPAYQVDALIEGILNELKNENPNWHENGASGKEPAATGATFPDTED